MINRNIEKKADKICAQKDNSIKLKYNFQYIINLMFIKYYSQTIIKKRGKDEQIIVKTINRLF